MSKAIGPIPADYGAGSHGRLEIGGHDIEAIVSEAGSTPLFVYDNNLIGSRIARFRHAMPDGIALHYAVKANPFPDLLKWICMHVDGFDVASSGELRALDQAGADCVAMSFAGPGKSDEDLFRAVKIKATVSVESEGEAARLIAIAGELGIRPSVMVRVNPPFALKGAGMKMGGLASPFGVDDDRAADLIKGLVDAGVHYRGLHVYAGSQCLDWGALAQSMSETVTLAARISEQAGVEPSIINLGGGFGIPYFPGEEPLDVDSLGRAVGEMLAEVPPVLGASRFAIELGRWLVGEAGVYLTRVVDKKVSRGQTFLVTDGGLHHMLSASGNFGQLLRRNYPVANASRFAEAAAGSASVVGCLCTPLDLLADNVAMPEAEVGDLIAVFCAGAYGLTASPQAFLSQKPAKEMLL